MQIHTIKNQPCSLSKKGTCIEESIDFILYFLFLVYKIPIHILTARWSIYTLDVKNGTYTYLYAWKRKKFVRLELYSIYNTSWNTIIEDDKKSKRGNPCVLKNGMSLLYREISLLGTSKLKYFLYYIYLLM